MSTVFLFLLSLTISLSSSSSHPNNKYVDCNDLDYPRQYVTYKLSPNDKITFDGILDEKAWTDVSWSDSFVDIEGPVKPPPYYDTKMKMRWDDTYLYIGGYLQEPQAFANLTINNSIIFYDNDFEVFIDPDGSNHYYKELELNARNLNWNLLLVNPYLNGGPAVCNFTQPHQCAGSAPGVPYWDIAPFLPSGTYVAGVINDPTKGSIYWTIEIGIPLRQYVTYNKYSSYPPPIGSYWRIDFSRVEWHIFVHQTDKGPVYWKDETKPVENWVWQATYVDPPDMHLPETWGYLQFADDRVNGTKLVKDTQWPVRDALMKVYYALTSYKQLYGMYTTDLMVLMEKVNLPKYVVIGECASVPKIELNVTIQEGREAPTAAEFVVTSLFSNWVGHVRDDRYLWVEPI